MVNIVLTVYNGINFIQRALDSLLAQTTKDFIISLVQDCDGLDYSGIIHQYIEKGLNIDHIINQQNLKQGLSRQVGIDAHPECSYVMFMDQDDELTSIAIEILLKTITESNAEMAISKILQETAYGDRFIGYGDSEILTELHGKIFSMELLKRCDIRFSPNIVYAEDTSFNFKAYFCSKKVQYINVLTYRWLNNSESVTRTLDHPYHQCMPNDFIYGLTEGIMHIQKYTNDLTYQTICDELMQFYKLAMYSESQHFPKQNYKDILKELGKQQYIKDLFKNKQALCYIASRVSGGFIYGENILFFEKSFIDWANDWLEH